MKSKTIGIPRTHAPENMYLRWKYPLKSTEKYIHQFNVTYVIILMFLHFSISKWTDYNDSKRAYH